jgi:hypothetical protein
MADFPASPTWRAGHNGGLSASPTWRAGHNGGLFPASPTWRAGHNGGLSGIPNLACRTQRRTFGATRQVAAWAVGVSAAISADVPPFLRRCAASCRPAPPRADRRVPVPRPGGPCTTADFRGNTPGSRLGGRRVGCDLRRCAAIPPPLCRLAPPRPARPDRRVPVPRPGGPCTTADFSGDTPGGHLGGRRVGCDLRCCATSFVPPSVPPRSRHPVRATSFVPPSVPPRSRHPVRATSFVPPSAPPRGCRPTEPACGTRGAAPARVRPRCRARCRGWMPAGAACTGRAGW